MGLKEIKVFALEGYNASDSQIAKAVEDLKKDRWAIHRIEHEGSITTDKYHRDSIRPFYHVLSEDTLNDPCGPPVVATYIICSRKVQ